MILGRIESIQVGRPRLLNAEGDAAKPWTSAIHKSPLRGPVRVGFTNIEGDEQADPIHHGGPDKAILAYAASHYPVWNAEFPEIPRLPGGFGENLTIEGLTETDCCIGDVVQVGGCRLEISQPRQPCWKLSRRWNIPKLAVLVQRTGRTGWYYRVLEEGIIETGQPVELISRPHPEFTVAWATTVRNAKPSSPEDDLRLAACRALSASWTGKLIDRATRNVEPDESRRLTHD